MVQTPRTAVVHEYLTTEWECDCCFVCVHWIFVFLLSSCSVNKTPVALNFHWESHAYLNEVCFLRIQFRMKNSINNNNIRVKSHPSPDYTVHAPNIRIIDDDSWIRTFCSSHLFPVRHTGSGRRKTQYRSHVRKRIVNVMRKLFP